tara:strand:+ start:816 stop:1037 length:222 start_codon:yes stop_codon:yes gene_type:complete
VVDGGVGNGLAKSGAVIHFYPSLSDFLIYFDYDSEQISSKCVDLKIGIAGTEFIGSSSDNCDAILLPAMGASL